MISFRELIKIQNNHLFDSFKKFSEPLRIHFGINHFWYYRISNEGQYSFVGTHAPWNEYCCNQVLPNFSTLPHLLRHPSKQAKGISLMKSSGDEDFKNHLDFAWQKYGINYNLNIIHNTSNGIEGYGFATGYKDDQIDALLINELPLLHLFVKQGKERHKKLFAKLDDFSVDLSVSDGFFNECKTPHFSINADQFLSKIGFAEFLSLTPRELEILKFIPKGYSASHIGKELSLSRRTVENYLALIKEKLFCQSKLELVQKSATFFKSTSNNY